MFAFIKEYLDNKGVIKPLCFFIFLTLLPALGYASTQLGKKWDALLHEGRIDSPEFYFSKEGKGSSHKEYLATLEAFREAVTQGQYEKICLFPSRYEVLRSQHLELPEVDFQVKCPKLGQFIKALNAHSVSLIFSAYYLNNPSSAFGHTFLRINQHPTTDGKRYELLDYGINYAATVDTSNALFYAIKGLFGMFPGHFTSVPYYLKVREYNNSESRDLWEYELNLEPEEVRLLVLHLWEVGQHSADYWYLTENCSYFIIAVIEAAAPRLDLKSRLKKYVIPSDTVTLIWQTPDLVKSVHYRPSIRTEFYERYALLDDLEKKEFLNIFKNQNHSGLKDLSLDSQVKVLDTVLDAYDFKYFYEIQDEKSFESQQKNKILSARARIAQKSQPIDPKPNPREKPHDSHGSRRVWVGTDQLGYRFALHDFLDPSWGYPQSSEISFAELSMEYRDQVQRLKHVYLFRVRSLQSVDPVFWNPSWFIETGVENQSYKYCIHCEYGVLRGGAGYSYAWGSQWSASLLLSAEVQKPLRGQDTLEYQLLGGGIFVVRAILPQDISMLFELSQTRNAQSDIWLRKSKLGLQKTISNSWGLRINLEDDQGEGRGSLSGLYYY